MSDSTKQRIKDTLFMLTTQMDIEKINVATLVKACGISRTIFYYHYSDMYALLEDVLTTDMEKVMRDCLKIEDGYDSVKYYIMCCSGYFPVIRKLIGTKYYETAERMISRLNQKYLRIVLEQKAATVPIRPDEATFFVDFLSAGLTAYLFQHCYDVNFSIERASQMIYTMIEREFWNEPLHNWNSVNI